MPLIQLSIPNFETNESASLFVKYQIAQLSPNTVSNSEPRPATVRWIKHARKKGEDMAPSLAVYLMLG